MFLKPFLLSTAIAGIIAGMAGATVWSQVKGVDIDESKLKIDPKPTILYDKNGQPFAQFHQDKKYMSTYDEIPDVIVNALVSTEDKYFWEHSGVSVKGTTRALYAVARAGGAFVQGGSTLTQQLAKQIYLHSGKDIDRKLEEWVIATEIEKKFTKEEIVAMYLNHVFYGQRAYGIKDAVETYFGEDLDQFKKDDRIDQIAKAALVAGLPQAPSLHNPYANPVKAKERRNLVIYNMMDQGYITKDEYEQAIKKPFLVLSEPYLVHEDEIIHYPEFTQYVLEEVRKQYDLKNVEEAMNIGLNIYTSFDPQVYKVLREKFSDDSLFPKTKSDGIKVQGSGVFLDPKTGEIYAMTGNRDEVTSDMFLLTTNRAYQFPRQPGSTIKPIIAYGPALESGKFTPTSSVLTANGSCFGTYCVKGGSSSPRASMDVALTNSWNVTAVWLLQQVGINYARDYAERLGITLTDEDRYLPIALGGLSKGVTTLQMADAYQAYANGGYRIPAHAIRRMTTQDGTIVYESPTDLSKFRVIKEKTASDMKYMLRNVVLKGTGTKANTMPNMMVAGKTGTVEHPTIKQYNKDVWFVGFTKDYVGAIWMGYDNTDDTHYLTDWSGTSANMFGQIIKPLLQIRPDLASDYSDIAPKQPKVEQQQLTADLDEDNRTVALSWNDEDDTYYKVYRNGKEVAQPKSTSYGDDNLDYDKTYTYQVRGFNKSSDFQTFETNVVTVLFKSPATKEREAEQQRQKELEELKKQQEEEKEQQEKEQQEQNEQPEQPTQDTNQETPSSTSPTPSTDSTH